MASQDAREDGERKPTPAMEEEEGEVNLPSTVPFVPAPYIYKRRNYRYYTREELDAMTPHYKGTNKLDRLVVMELRSDIYRFLRKLGEALQNKFDTPPHTVAAAAALAHRFFARRSMVANDRYLIAAACFFIAGKATYVPRAMSDVAAASFRIRCESKPDLLPLYEAARFRSDYQDAILAAEGAVLHANAFNFHSGQDVTDLHLVISSVLDDEYAYVERGEGPYDNATRTKILASKEPLRETARNIAHDLFRSDVPLQFSGPSLALAVLRVALRLMKEKKRVPPNYQFLGGEGGESWYARRGASEADMELMLKEVYAVLNRKAPHPSSVPTVEPVPKDILEVATQQEEERRDMEASGMLANPYADLVVGPYMAPPMGPMPMDFRGPVPPPMPPPGPPPPGAHPGPHGVPGPIPPPRPPPGPPPPGVGPPGGAKGGQPGRGRGPEPEMYEISYDDL